MLGGDAVDVESYRVQAKVHGVGVCRGSFPSPLTFCPGQLNVERGRNPAGDGLLQRIKVRNFILEAIGPDMGGGGRINELCVGLYKCAHSSDAAFQGVAHAKLSPDLPDIDSFPLICEGGSA